MFNKLSKKQFLDLLGKETLHRVNVSFYKYVVLENLDNLRDNLYETEAIRSFRKNIFN